jgi:hypothetical protein
VEDVAVTILARALCLAAAACLALAPAAHADGATFSEMQGADDNFVHIDVTFEMARAGLPPREANFGVGTVRISLPGARGARFDPSRPTEPAGYDCAVTNSVYGEADTGFLCSSGGEASGAGLAFPSAVTVHLLLADCWTPPVRGSAQPAVADGWMSQFDPGTAPDATFQLFGDPGCQTGYNAPLVDRDTTSTCIVPKLPGYTLAMAELKLSRAGCARGKVKRVFSSKVKKGRVISQSVKAGKHLRVGSRVPLVVSLGAKKTPRG